jgi:signal transduction histidine kinase
MGTVTASRRLGLIGSTLGLLLLSIVGIVLLAVTIVAGALSIVGVGIPLVLGALVLLRSIADVHRGFASLVGVEIIRPYRAAARGGLLRRLRARASDPATWRDLGWVLLNGTAGMAIVAVPLGLALSALWYATLPILWNLVPPGLFASNGPTPMSITTFRETLTKGLPLAVLAAVLCWWWTPPFLRAYARLSRLLLGPAAAERLAVRVTDLTESRSQTVDAQAAELRRIERDLHDGAQARLAGVGMSIGLAEEMLTRDPAQLPALLADARVSTGMALAELRDLVRGIHPPALADRGLAGGVHALALTSARPVAVLIELAGRPPAAVESAVYFGVAELLANAAKHGGDRVSVSLRHERGRLVAAVTDNGRGGAAASPGSGLDGVVRRLAAFDGTLRIDSPAGGPTTMTIEVPCALS